MGNIGFDLGSHIVHCADAMHSMARLEVGPGQNSPMAKLAPGTDSSAPEIVWSP